MTVSSMARPVKQALTQSLFDHIPVGVGSQGVIPTTMRDLEEALEMGSEHATAFLSLPFAAFPQLLIAFTVFCFLLRSQWTGRSGRAMPGPRTRSTVRHCLSLVCFTAFLH